MKLFKDLIKKPSIFGGFKILQKLFNLTPLTLIVLRNLGYQKNLALV